MKRPFEIRNLLSPVFLLPLHQGFSARLRRFSIWAFPNPRHPHLVKNVCDILLLVTLQMSILPDMGIFPWSWDLITPFLVVSCQSNPLPQALLQALVGAFALEMHTSAPRGLYVTVYSGLVITLLRVRHQISWRRHGAWVVSLGGAALWVMVFEFLVQRTLSSRVGLSSTVWVWGPSWDWESPLQVLFVIVSGVLRLCWGIAFGGFLLRCFGLTPSEEV